MSKDETNVKEVAVSAVGGMLAQSGKYLTFALEDEDYGIEILKVREIIGVMEITPVPQVPVFVKGVINLRGKVIPVLDLRLKFGMDEIAYTEETCIIVVSLDNVFVGLIIDRVNEVLDIAEKFIEPAPKMGSSINAEYLSGIGKVSDTVKLLLNIEKVLGDDLSSLS